MTKQEYKEIAGCIKALEEAKIDPRPSTLDILQAKIDALEWVLRIAKLPRGASRPYWPEVDEEL